VQRPNRQQTPRAHPEAGAFSEHRLGPSGKVLVVEDDHEDAIAISEGLAEHISLRLVVVAASGDDAIDMVLDRYSESDRPLIRPAVVIIDLSTPRGGGLYVLARLKKDPRTTAIPVVIFTASTATENVDVAYRLGANAYVVKPAQRAEFVSRVASIAAFWLNRNVLPRGEL
jgi:two-component system response regulator